MKKLLLFIAIFLLVISCSKNNSNSEDLEITKGTLIKSSFDSFKSTPIQSTLDSLARMNRGSFLPSNLTLKGIDSIAKIISSAVAVQSIIAIAGQQYTDLSGLIHLQVFWNSSTQYLNISHIEVPIPTDYVVVGGGAAAFNNQNGYGAFLYESRPDAGLTKWIASSKAHIDPDPHLLTAYAIGMKIDGVDPAYLRSKIHYVSATSTLSRNHPYSSVSIPANCLLLGGGAFDDWHGYGNMLTESYPQLNTWYVAGQDYRRADPCFITAYAIGIENIYYPGVGYLEVTINTNSAQVGTGFQSTNADVISGWALTCPAGFIGNTYRGWGRMITKLYPYSINRATLESKDSFYEDWGPQTVVDLMIKVII